MILLLLEFHEVLSKYILLTPLSMNRYMNLNPKEGKRLAYNIIICTFQCHLQQQPRSSGTTLKAFTPNTD